MGYAIYQIGKGRWGGYGVPAYCEHPECNEEIDRGVAYACGGEPFSELGCDQYFCSKHLEYAGFKRDGSGERCDHDEENCSCEFLYVCHPCATGEQHYPYKKEHPRFLYHLLHDYSWKKWRRDNLERVAAITREIGDYKPPVNDKETNEEEIV